MREGYNPPTSQAIDHVLAPERPLDATHQRAESWTRGWVLMALAPGAQLGSYEIVGAIGAGGMGEKLCRW